MHRRKIPQFAHLQMTSMLDMFTLILAFLLQAIAINPVNITLSDKLEIPTSNSKVIPTDTLLDVTISQEAILLKGIKLIDLINMKIPASEYDQSGNITKLSEALKKELENYKFIDNKKRELLGEKSTKPEETENLETDRQLMIIADKNMDFTIIQEVLYTAGALGMTKFRFAVIEKS